eukprot:4652187-Amphidinium_carterae.1
MMVLLSNKSKNEVANVALPTVAATCGLNVVSLEKDRMESSLQLSLSSCHLEGCGVLQQCAIYAFAVSAALNGKPRERSEGSRAAKGCSLEVWRGLD